MSERDYNEEKEKLYSKLKGKLYSKLFELNHELKMTLRALEVIDHKERKSREPEPTQEEIDERHTCSKCRRLHGSTFGAVACCAKHL